jgi:DNA mismatch repair protein MutS
MSDQDQRQSGSPAQEEINGLTPAMRQYTEQKAQMPDAILLFRIGDFYETFYEDAKTVARVLGLTLTARSKGENPVPMAGVPHHALETYLARLVQAGLKVAIAEQVEDPRHAKGLVRRQIVRIVTPGTLTDESLLKGREDNWLAGICPAAAGKVGLAWVELASGRFLTLVLEEQTAVDELVRLHPAELLIGEDAMHGRLKDFLRQVKELTGCAVTRLAEWQFEAFQAQRRLHEQFQVTTLEGFGYQAMDASLQAAGAILDYLQQTQRTQLAHIRAIHRRNAGTFVQIDRATLRSLEIERTLRTEGRAGTLLEVLDRTANPMGARLLRQWLCYPLLSEGDILARQQSIQQLLDHNSQMGKVRQVLANLGDIERIAARLGIERATPRDLANLAAALSQAPGLQHHLAELDDPLLRRQTGKLAGLETLAEVLCRAIRPDASTIAREGTIIADGFDAELDRLRALSRDATTWLAQYQATQIERTGIPSLRVGYNKVFGYYIEITHAHKDRIPADYVRKQTVKNAERYITEPLKEYENEVLTAQERAKELEQELFGNIRRQARQFVPQLQAAADAVATLDVLAGLAQLAAERRYCRPEIVDGTVLDILEGRHPVLDQTLSEKFVPNDTTFDEKGRRLMVITGPNMAGKSTYIRQVALLVLMAQIGSFVPARSMRWGLVDRIFARVGASDEISRGQSTFMVEMVETANILHNASRRSLVILDEIGRGTSTFDGLSLAWAITEYLSTQVGCRTLFATHYHELTELPDLLEGVKNLNVAVREYHDEVIFLHRIVAGGADKSYGVHVARLAGIPREVLTRAGEVLAELEQNFARQSHDSSLAAERTRDQGQMLLFDTPHPVVEQLRQANLGGLTPEQALELLKSLQKQAKRT